MTLWSSSACGAIRATTHALGEKFRIPWFTDLEQLCDQVRPHAVIVSVNYRANEKSVAAQSNWVCTRCSKRQSPMISPTQTRSLLKQTHTEYTSKSPSNIIAAHRAIEKRVDRAGKFGQVHVACNDCMGMAITASVSFVVISDSTTPLCLQMVHRQVCGSAHYAWIERKFCSRDEDWEHGILHFADGRLGFFNCRVWHTIRHCAGSAQPGSSPKKGWLSATD